MEEIFLLLSEHPSHPRRTYHSRRALAKAICDGLVEPGAQQYGHTYPARRLVRFVPAGTPSQDVDLLALARRLAAAHPDDVDTVEADLDAAL